MKKKFLFLLLFLVTIGSGFGLTYTIELSDSYGDGWNGGKIDVLVNDILVIDDLTIENPSGWDNEDTFNSQTFVVTSLDVITTVYTAGSYPTENSYQIKNELGIVVAESGQGGALPGNVNYTVPEVIEGTPDAPTLVSPANLATDVAIDTDLTWTIGANTDHSVLYLADNAEFTTPLVDGVTASSPYTTSLANGTTYYWKVVAVSATSVEASSPVRSFTTVLGENNYIWTLADSYNDSWNGAVMDVLVDGVVVLDDISLPSGPPQEWIFSAEPGQVITSDFHTPGSFPGECSFTLKDYLGEVLASGNSTTPISYAIPQAGAPDTPTLVSPANLASNVAIDTDLTWTSGENTDHAVLYLADNEEFTDANVINPATSPYTTSLTSGTTYYWKVVAVSASAIEMSSVANNFTTEFGAVSEFPYEEGFEDAWVGSPAAPAGWGQLTVSGSNVWNRNTFSPNTGSACAQAPWASAGGEHLLVTPTFDLDASTDYRLKFWLKGSTSAGTDLQVQIADAYTDASDFSTELASFVAGTNMPNTWTEQIISLAGYSGNQAIAFRMIDDDGYSLYIDNVTVEEAPSTPIATLSATELDFGTVNVGETGSELVSISNTGAGTLNISTIEISGTNAADFVFTPDSEGPWALANGDDLIIEVDFTPSAEGERIATLEITDDLGSKVSISSVSKADKRNRAVNSVTLTGSGFVMPAGNHHDDPIVLTLADEIIETG
ncbi:choice-of-anchor D domain-containing protein, partial [bacterium]|nr:choice-of-anchor D domain-containing protein [bacterium]